MKRPTGATKHAEGNFPMDEPGSLDKMACESNHDVMPWIDTFVGIEMQPLELFRELATTRGVASATPTSRFERLTY